MMINILRQFTTRYDPCSVEWCPHELFKNYFVCACYEFTKTQDGDQRVGNIMLFSLKKNALTLHQEIKTEGILDQKWSLNKLHGRIVLAVATTKKNITLYQLIADTKQLEILSITPFTYANRSDFLLSLDWSTCKYSTLEPEIVCSDSKGYIHRISLNDTTGPLQSWNAHSFQAWISAYYYWDPNIIFTGGDDALLKKFDQRIGIQAIATCRADAGVTSIHSNIFKEHLLITGSYDTYIRLWDMRKMKHTLSDLRMPGPVWRLKWDPFEGEEILAACMLEGVHILNSHKNELKIQTDYAIHKSMVYGVDWSFMSKNDLERMEFNEGKIIASCSFYDRLLCVWDHSKEE